MPELPEVESYKSYIDNTSLDKPIELIRLAAPNMLLNTSRQKLKAALTNNTFVDTKRHGKFLFLRLREKGNLLLHFGLSGDLIYTKPGEEAPSRYALQFHFADDSDLYFTDTRKLGKIALVDDVDTFIKKRGYGIDALEISESEFTDAIRNKKVAIKTVLMDQKIIAGVGNEYSDEILFEAKIHPATPTVLLSKKQLSKIYTLMVSILKESIKQKADREKTHNFFFLTNRKAGLTCPNCKGKTAFQTIGGRSSYFCPRCQKMKKATSV